MRRTAIHGFNEKDLQSISSDAPTRAMTILDNPHHEIHEGSSYVITRSVTLPVGADDEIRIATPDTSMFLSRLIEIETARRHPILSYVIRQTAQETERCYMCGRLDLTIR